MESIMIQLNVFAHSGLVLLHSMEVSVGKASVCVVLPDLPLFCGLWVENASPAVQSAVCCAPAVQPTPQPLVEPVAPVLPAAPEFSVELLDKKIAPEMASVLRHVREGLQAHQLPERIPHGVNGTYFLKDKFGSKVAVFKPTDEEFCGADSDGSDASDDSASFGLLPGETAVREAAAFRVAREHPNPAFHLVPPTGLVRIASPRATFAPDDPFGTETIVKTGSLQEYVAAEGDSEEFGPSRFPVDDVHKIGVLDLQILNGDRNSQNVLVKEQDDGALSLVPIDHGFSMPAGLSLGAGRFEWMNYPAARKPFSADTLAYIEAIPVERVLAMLRDEMRVRPECLVGVRASHVLLKRGAAAGLTLYEIGDCVCRRDIDLPSDLELAHEAARREAGDDDDLWQNVLCRKIDELIARKLSER